MKKTRVRIKGGNEYGVIIDNKMNHENRVMFVVKTDSGRITDYIPFDGVEYRDEYQEDKDDKADYEQGKQNDRD